MASIKGPAPAPTSFPGAEKLRIGIVHARWNEECITPLVSGCVDAIAKTGVKPENIVIESVPGSWELPFGVSRMISASQVQAASNVSDLMGATFLLDDSKPATPTTGAAGKASKSALDAVIGIGVLIKGSTMHFEYISESCCSGLMRVGLDTGVPVILGVLTALTEDQALERSGVGRGANKGHNHGLDWGAAAVEYVSSTRPFAETSSFTDALCWLLLTPSTGWRSKPTAGPRANSPDGKEPRPPLYIQICKKEKRIVQPSLFPLASLETECITCSSLCKTRMHRLRGACMCQDWHRMLDRPWHCLKDSFESEASCCPIRAAIGSAILHSIDTVRRATVARERL